MIPLSPIWQLVILGTAGLAGATATAKWGSVPTAAGILGGTIAMTALRGIELYALSKATAEARGALPPPEGGSLFSSRAVREGGSVGPGLPNYAPSMASNPLGGYRTVPEGGYMGRYLPANARLMGPNSWATDAGAVYKFRSAHNV